MENNNINPALQGIQELTGTWEMELSNASFLPDPKTTIKGKAIFEWLEGGDFLILRQGRKGQDTHWASWLIGRDRDADNYTVLYLDNQQSSRVFEMSYEKELWILWRNSPGFMQRFTGKVNEDKQMITGYWENSADGTTWSHDFDLKYVKTGKI